MRSLGSTVYLNIIFFVLYKYLFQSTSIFNSPQGQHKYCSCGLNRCQYYSVYNKLEYEVFPTGSTNNKINSSGYVSLLAFSGRTETSSVLSQQPDVIDYILQSTMCQKRGYWASFGIQNDHSEVQVERQSWEASNISI